MKSRVTQVKHLSLAHVNEAVFVRLGSPGKEITERLAHYTVGRTHPVSLYRLSFVVGVQRFAVLRFAPRAEAMTYIARDGSTHHVDPSAKLCTDQLWRMFCQGMPLRPLVVRGPFARVVDGFTTGRRGGGETLLLWNQSHHGVHVQLESDIAHRLQSCRRLFHASLSALPRSVSSDGDSAPPPPPPPSLSVLRQQMALGTPLELRPFELLELVLCEGSGSAVPPSL